MPSTSTGLVSGSASNELTRSSFSVQREDFLAAPTARIADLSE
jgi:hypothetical protein